MAKDIEKNSKNKRHFWKDFKAELKKVIWPTPKQLFKNTVAVLFIVIITSAIVFVLDLAFDAINTYGVNRLKGAIKNSVSVETVDDSESSDLELEEGESQTETKVDLNGAEESETAE